MSGDLVSRLRSAVIWQGVVPYGDELAKEAADEIERLEADVAELRKNQITPEIILRVASLHTTIREQAEKIERLRELVFRAR